MKFLTDVKFGIILQKIRRSKKLTQMEVVARMQTYGSKMSNDTYSKIERDVRNIFVEDFVILKLALGVDYKDIFDAYEIQIKQSSLE